ncbi:MAG: discoidin domain-containing protein [Armatimonadetes bacterium]|nr:discoidin domain-containing protein [Armatimonadota bacterium]
MNSNNSIISVSLILLLSVTVQAEPTSHTRANNADIRHICSSVKKIDKTTSASHAEHQPTSACYSAQIKYVPQVVATVESHHVYAIGDVDIYAVSPDFRNGVVLQEANNFSQRKIIPKKSRDLHPNYIGAGPPRLPRSEVGEEYPFRTVHLIDGDPETFWRSRPTVAADLNSEWVRVDLPSEQKVNRVVLIPTPLRQPGTGYQYGTLPAFPVDFTIQVSRDAWHWDTVCDVKGYTQPSGTAPQVFGFTPRMAKQIRLVITRLAAALGDDGRQTFNITLAEIQVLDEAGNDVALVSRGAGVTVSSTDYGYPTKRETNNILWSLHYDLGVKWLKVGYFMDRTNWFHVERTKGQYRVDPVTDAAITDAVENGIEVILTLCYGNPLYQDYPGYKGLQKGFWEMPYNEPLHASEAIEGYGKYCRFMVDHFRGRVHYFEIWNNPDGEFSLESDPKPYLQTVITATKRIKETNPQAKIVLGGMSLMKLEFFRACFEGGLAPLVDVIAWHPYQLAFMPEECYEPGFKSYAEWVAALRKMASGYGFKGELHANEVNYAAAYPQNKKRPVRPDWNYDVSELTKAKYLARLVFLHAGLDIPVFWNEIWNDQHVDREVGLLRNTVSADPQSPLSPQAAYYVMRTCATVLDGVSPAAIPVEVVPASPEIQTYAFTNAKGERLIALWLAIREDDEFSGREISIVLHDVDSRRAVGIDTLNGFEQQLRAMQEGNNLRIPNLVVRDYPLVIRLEG